MQRFRFSVLELGAGFWKNRRLIRSLIQREVVGRYQGSMLGLFWSFFNPVFMLSVYTFIFSVIFKARWGDAGSGSKIEFALILFGGMLVFNLFAECINRAPTLITANPTYVKKVVFPLEILPWVSFGSALFHATVSLGVWLLLYLPVFGPPPLTILLLPLMLLPYCLLIMGLSWFLASLGVYLRDVAQVTGIVMTALMFLTPIFYPITAIPVAYHRYIYLNPLTYVVEQTRDLLYFGRGIVWGPFTVFTCVACLIAWLGFVWFQKTRKGFADVL